MNNKNERIDLTQFEGMVEGPWNAGFSRNIHTLKETGYVRNEQVQLIGEGFTVNKPTLLAVAAVPSLIAELKKMYEREDALVSAIKELCDSEDSTGCSGDLTVVSLDPMLKLYELTSYSAYR